MPGGSKDEGFRAAGRDRRARRQNPQRRAAHDPPDRKPAQLLAPDRRRRRAVFPASRDGSGRIAAGGLPIASRNGAGGADHRAFCGARRCRWSATQNCCFRFSAISSPTPSNIRRAAAASRSTPISSADEVVVAIADHGIGIPSGDLDQLFERYHRGSNVSGIVGTGVGLYLVKMVVDLHGGRVEVTSEEGEGSCFTVRLPFKCASPRPGILARR